MTDYPKVQEWLLLASYCGGEGDCTDARPCVECLSMCNIFKVADDDPVFIRALGEFSLSPTPDAGEVRTYRKGVEDAARVADELANVPAVGRTPTDKFHNRIERTMARTIAAAIRKLP